MRRPTVRVPTPCPQCPEQAITYEKHFQLRVQCPACGYKGLSPDNARLTAELRKIHKAAAAD